MDDPAVPAGLFIFGFTSCIALITAVCALIAHWMLRPRMKELSNCLEAVQKGDLSPRCLEYLDHHCLDLARARGVLRSPGGDRALRAPADLSRTSEVGEGARACVDDRRRHRHRRRRNNLRKQQKEDSQRE